MKINNIKFNRYYSILFLSLLISFTGSKANSQENKKTETGEIVMSAAELESLLTKIAERRKETLKNNKSLHLPTYQLRSGVTYQDPRMYQDMKSLEYKLDILLSRANLAPNQGGSTTYVLPPQNSGTTIPNNATKLADVPRKILKGHQVFFANNSTTISSSDKRIIQDLIPMIKENQNQTLVVLKGFASVVGNAFYNNQLSYNRADAIKQILVNNGVNPGNIMIIYHGADQTIKADEARRVDITLELVPNN